MSRFLTPGLQEAVVDGGQIVCVIEVHDAVHGEELLSTDPTTEKARLKIVSGEITTDETRGVVGTGSADLLIDQETAEALIPLVSNQGLSPTAPARIHVRFKAEGETELMNYGVYEVDTLRANESSQGVVMSVEVSDNSRRVERARFWRPEKVVNRTKYPDAFRQILVPILPESRIDIAPTSARTGEIVFDIQDDRLARVNEMATAIGFRIDWNAEGYGHTNIYPDTDTNDEPMWVFTDGGNARVTTVNRVLTDERSYNGVIAMGESTGSDTPPVRAEAWDTDPDSPTYFDPTKPEESVYGPVPFFYVSEFITTKKQAREAAVARLPKVLGLVEVLSIEALPNPGIVPGDPILVTRPKLGVTGVFVVESVVMPLTGSQGRMTIVCRDRRIFV